MLQVALDMLDARRAVEVCTAAREHIDVIEAGTLLCLSEGMGAVRTLRAAFPDKTLLADVRIVRAGANIAALAFEAGADWVTVVGEAPIETVKAACEVAAEKGGEVQVELADDFDPAAAVAWRDLGIRQVITHNSSEVGTVGMAWSAASLNQVRELAGMGFDVTVTGGIKPDTIPVFDGLPIHIFIAGRGIWGADDPGRAAADYAAAIAARQA